MNGEWSAWVLQRPDLYFRHTIVEALTRYRTHGVSVGVSKTAFVWMLEGVAVINARTLLGVILLIVATLGCEAAIEQSCKSRCEDSYEDCLDRIGDAQECQNQENQCKSKCDVQGCDDRTPEGALSC